jgi:hypothetical protein
MDLERAMKNPASTFGTPEAVLASSGLTAVQKRAVLLQWQDQLEQLQAADEEGMRAAETPNGPPGDLLRRVSSLISRIDEDARS